MPVAYCHTPLGITRITEDDGFISGVSVLNDEHEVTPAPTLLLQTAINQLNEYFKGDRKTFDLPIRQPGSDFQQKVWDQLLKINYGSTITYSQQSNLMINPLAIRA